MSTPLFQEALIEAKKLREAAANEAKNAVLEAVSPIIKQMIDREISGVILEQEEDPMAAAAPEEMPPPAPPAPTADAGATGPIDSPLPAGAPPANPLMPGMAPAVAKAAPPIIAPEGSMVPGKFETDPTTGQPTIVLNINDLFTKTAPEAVAGTEELPPPSAPAPESLDASALPAPVGASPEELAPPASPEEEAVQPPALAEIYRAVQKLIAEQKKTGKKIVKEQAAAPAPAAPAVDPNAPPPAPPAPADPNAAAPPIAPAAMGAGIVPPPAAPVAPPAPGAPAVDVNAMVAGAAPPAAAPAVDPNAPAPTAAVPAAPPAPVDPNAVPPAPAPAAAPAPAPAAPQQAPAAVQEYKVFKTKLERIEESVNALAKPTANRSSLVKESHQREILSLYGKLVSLKENNAISARVFSSNEERLDLLHENLDLIYSYTQNPLTKGKTMKTKNSLRDFARSLFEGAEGFEKEVGHVDPAGDSEGGSAEHAHSHSGNPKGHKAEAEKAKFPTKEKSEWPGKPAPTSLLEQLEEEIAEMMGELHAEESVEECGEMEGAEEAVLEMSDEEVMAEAKKARARIKALREQFEEEGEEDSAGEDAAPEMGAEGDEGADHLSLTIDLDGVSGDEVENVNVSIDGEDLDVDMAGGGDDLDGDLDMAPAGDEGGEESEEEMLDEARKQIRKGLQAVNEGNVLRKQLQETQLLTARSLYLNKIFVRDDLSGAQKRKIVEYLDSARTIAEAKEIYNRVVRVLNTAAKTGVMKESAERPAQILAEAAGIVEPSFDTSRWQMLAGVKKTAK